ncbi:MAG: hypothetical protein EOO25_16295 [Comamonadaceae bacterium]|nr:MAG: hypothetical protein EOO25_16295 [Comamonadaceae bacterium]
MNDKTENRERLLAERLQKVEDALELRRVIDKDLRASKRRFLVGRAWRYLLVLLAIYCWYFGLMEDLVSGWLAR